MKLHTKSGPDILFVGAEITPLIKTGGLADVVGALPKAIHALEQRITVAVPYNEHIDKKRLTKPRFLCSLRVSFGKNRTAVDVFQTVMPATSIPLLLFKNDRFLSKGSVYASAHVWDPVTIRWATPQLSTVIRFILFSQAVVQFLRQTHPVPKIIHLNDWHTAAIAYLAHHDELLAQCKFLLTIHNGQHVGQVKPRYSALLAAALSGTSFRLLDLGCVETDVITTVSRQYAKELLTPEYGNGLEALLRARHDSFFGILNGLDMELFNPKSDPYIDHHFSISALAGKVKNKLALQKRLGFTVSPRTPLIGLVHRLDQQKGIDLVLALLPKLLRRGVQCLVEGTGNIAYETCFKQLQQKFPDRLYFHDVFDEQFSHQIYAASDIFLMPSRFEPCGLGQLIAMRYGSVPVVRATGGLKDTVHQEVNGFVFTAYSRTALWRALHRALATYQREPVAWRKLQRAGMKADYSWNVSAKQYVTLYQCLLAGQL